MAWKLQLPTSGFITIPTWTVSASQDFVIDIVFDTPPALAVDGVIGNSTDPSFLATFTDTGVQTKLAGTFLTGSNTTAPPNANVLTANNKFRWRVERVSNVCRVTITNLTTDTVKQDVTGISFSSGFSFTWLGNTQGLILGGGDFYTVELSRSGDNRYYDANASGGTGTVLPDTGGGAQNGTQSGSGWPADNSEWVFYSSGATYQLTALGGTFTYSGQTAALNRGFKLSAQGGAYSYTGASANLSYTTATIYRLDALGASYSYAGASASLLRGFVLDSQGGAYSYAGASADLSVLGPMVYRLTALGATYVYSGANATLTATGVIPAANPAAFVNRAYVGGRLTNSAKIGGILTNNATVAI